MSELINIGRIARLLRMDRDKVIALADRAGSMYSRQILQIGTKRRVIDIPHTELKIVQRQLHDRVFSTVPSASAVYSVAGRGVIKNAQQHLDQPFMAVLDIVDCFPSISVAMIRQGLRRVGFDDVAARYVTRLVTLRGRLPQGPPSSPAIMNIVLGELDAALELAAVADGSVYTRYMDDICFSGDHDMSPLAAHARAVLRRNGFRTNKKKSQCWGPEDRHTVTKIVVSSSLNPTPEYLNALNNELMRNRQHLSDQDCRKLEGKIAWVKALNPMLGMRLYRPKAHCRIVA